MSKKKNLKKQFVDLILDDEENKEVVDSALSDTAAVVDEKPSQNTRETLFTEEKNEIAVHKDSKTTKQRKNFDSTFVIQTKDDSAENTSESIAMAELEATNTLQKLKKSFGKVFQGETRKLSPQAEIVSLSTAEKIAKAESIQMAQERILGLENELEQVRAKNEELLAAGEVLRRKTEELRLEVETLSRAKRDLEENLKNEVQVLEAKNSAKDREIGDLKIQVESLELRLKADLNTVRVRERELENRLELMKSETAAIVRNKDELILELKRNLDQAMLEMENYKEKGRKLNEEVEQSEERIRRAVKAMRLALSLLEGESAMAFKDKKTAS